MKRVINIRLDDDLLKKIEKKAKKEKINRSDLVRKALNNYCANENFFKNHEDVFVQYREKITNLQKELHPIGSNLNQIAYYWNSRGKIHFKNLYSVQKELKDMFKKVIEIQREILRSIKNANKV